MHVPAPSSPAHSLLLCLAPLCCLVLLVYSSNPCRTEALYRQAVRRGGAIWRSPSGCQPCWPWVAQVGFAQHTFFGVAQLLCLPPPCVPPALDVSAYPMSLGSSVPACLAIGGVAPPVGVSLADTRRAAGALAGRLPRRPTCCFAALPASSLAHSIVRGTIRALARVPLPLASLTL